MTFDTSLAAGVIVLYALGTLGILASTLSLHPSIKKAANLLTLAGFALHSLAAIMAFLPESIAELPFGFYMQMLAWCLVFLYIAAWRWLRYPFLGLTAAPLALLLYCSPYVSQTKTIYCLNIFPAFSCLAPLCALLTFRKRKQYIA